LADAGFIGLDSRARAKMVTRGLVRMRGGSLVFSIDIGEIDIAEAGTVPREELRISRDGRALRLPLHYSAPVLILPDDAFMVPPEEDEALEVVLASDGDYAYLNAAALPVRIPEEDTGVADVDAAAEPEVPPVVAAALNKQARARRDGLRRAHALRRSGDRRIPDRSGSDARGLERIAARKRARRAGHGHLVTQERPFQQVTNLVELEMPNKFRDLVSQDRQARNEARDDVRKAIGRALPEAMAEAARNGSAAGEALLARLHQKRTQAPATAALDVRAGALADDTEGHVIEFDTPVFKDGVNVTVRNTDKWARRLRLNDRLLPTKTGETPPHDHLQSSQAPSNSRSGLVEGRPRPELSGGRP